MSDVEITDMSTKDLGLVLALEREIFPSPWTADFFKHELSSHETFYLVARVGTEPVGYMGAHILGHEVHVTNLAVAPAWRRRGIGSAMLLESVSRGLRMGSRWLTLEVREGNMKALEFYRKFGFRELGLRRGYYPDTGEHAVIMATGDITEPAYRETLERISAELDSGDGGA